MVNPTEHMQYDHPWERILYQGQMSHKGLWPADPLSDPDLSEFLVIKVAKDYYM